MKINLPKDVNFIIGTLEAHGHTAYAVGGCVRDMFLRRTPGDFDVTTSARPEEVKALFRHTVDTGIAHGTVTVMLNRIGYEVTTYRIDGAYHDSRHPESVTFTPELSEDLRRRDFTINAMAYNEKEGVIDLFGGQEDLEAGIVRAVGVPAERFTEDALRIMRCVRFAAQLGFTIDPETFRAAEQLAPTLVNISRERIRDELLKILLSDHPDYVRILHDIGAFDDFYPEFCHSRAHMLDVLLRTPKDKIMRLCAFLHASGETVADSEAIAERVLTELRFDNDTIRRTLHLIHYHTWPLTSERAKVRKLISLYGAEDMDQLITYVECDHQADHEDVRAEVRDVLSAGECTSLKELAVSGKDMLKLGMRPGKEIGDVLQMLLDEVLLDPAKNEKETLLRIVCEKTVKNLANENEMC